MNHPPSGLGSVGGMQEDGNVERWRTGTRERRKRVEEGLGLGKWVRGKMSG